MMTSRTLRPVLLVAASLMCGFAALPAAQAQAQAYPDRPVRLIVTFGPGGLADVVTRTVAVPLARELKQSVVVENRAGAGGAIGAQAVASAEPDGYTLMIGTPSTQVINPLIFPKLAYDPKVDFRSISMFAETPLVLTVGAASPHRSVAELVQAARERPGALTFSSAGIGTAPHLAMEVFQQATGTRLVHVPFKSGGEAVGALLAGQVDVLVEALPVVGPHIAGARLRALAVPRAERLGVLPDVPTAAEAGQPGFVVAAPWTGLAAPAKTPPERLQVLQRAVDAALQDAALRSSLEARGIFLLPRGPEAYEAALAGERKLWEQVIRTAGVTVQ